MRTLRLIAFVAMLVVISGGYTFAADKKPKKTEIEKLEERIAQLEKEPPSERLEREKDEKDRRAAIEKLRNKRNTLILKDQRKGEDPELTRVRSKRVKNEKKAKDVEDKIRRSRNSIELSGCPLDDTIWVNPSVGTEYGLKPSSANSSFVVTIVNPRQNNYNVDIMSSLHGELIKTLCPGGELMITFAARNWGPQSDQVTLTARTEVSGKTLLGTFTFNLQNVTDSRYRTTDSRVWRLSLR